MGIYDVPAAMLIEEVAKDLKAKVKKPAFADYVKTGSHKERAPSNPDWYFYRMASVLYRAYKEGNTGTGSLRTYYGGRKNRGVKPEQKRKASGKVIRSCLQMLEKEGLLKKGKFGRKVSPKGEKYLFEKAKGSQVVFDGQLQKRKQEHDDDAAKRTANRQKQLAQAAAAASAQKPPSGQKKEFRPPAGQKIAEAVPQKQGQPTAQQPGQKEQAKPEGSKQHAKPEAANRQEKPEGHKQETKPAHAGHAAAAEGKVDGKPQAHKHEAKKS